MLNVQIFHITSRFCNFLNCYLAHADLAADLAVAVADLAHLAVAVAVADLAHHSLDLAHLAVAADLGYLAFAALADLAAGLAPNNVKRTKFFV